MNISEYVVLGLIAGAILIDIALTMTGKASISKVIQRWQIRFGFVTFLLGYVLGHWTWPLASCAEELMK
jgi:hypothetical protein